MRISTVCSLQNVFNVHISNLKDWFLARVYPQKVVKKQIEKVVSGKQSTCKDASEQAVSFVATYHPKLKTDKLIKHLPLFL